MNRLNDIWLRCVLRPLGRLLGTDLWEPHLVLRSCCPDCGTEETSYIAASTSLYDHESGAVYGLECGSCGERRATTLGVMDGVLRTETDPCIFKTPRESD